MKRPMFQRKHIRYLLWTIAVIIPILLIWQNLGYSKVYVLWLFTISLPSALLWALFFLLGALVGYFFQRWEKKVTKRGNSRKS